VKNVRVVAAVIRRGRHILITRRREDGERGGLWEFPGGKVEAGEAEPDALRREIAEELGCGLDVGGLILRHRHRYPDLEVELAFYACTLQAGSEPRELGVAALLWAESGTLATHPFCEADVPVLPLLEQA
jgi:8-oxo-dGTP diphosphatase